MRFFNTQQVARPVLPDRNPTAKSFGFFTSGVAPHTATTRWTYTVPANRKFVVGLIQNLVIRLSVATTAGETAAYNQYTPNGGGMVTTLVAINYGNAASNGMNTVGSSGQVINAGDVINGQTYDTSTGGTNTFGTSLVGTEGDA